jgi:hypothetical protein
MKLVFASIGVVWVAAAGVAGGGAVRSCGTLTVGPTAIRTGGAGAGAPCMLAAFARCVAARYRLSSFGIDTVATTSFSIARSGGGGCSVSVARTFQVVPQPPLPSGGGTCAAIASRAGDIAATGCRGSGLASIVSLTGK